LTVSEIKMTKRNGLRAWAWLWSVTFVAGADITVAHAADLAPGPAPSMVPAVEIVGPVYGYFNPVIDPRCRIVPQPEANLYGDTARFRPTAVCQSRGLYADSVLFP
jgi:hypothetical protein